jgi:H+/Cl- antiporter ClcA
MKSKIKSPKTIWPFLGGILGALLSFYIVSLMVEGILQEHVKFSGPIEEMIFTLFAIVIGIISLSFSASSFFEGGKR